MLVISVYSFDLMPAKMTGSYSSHDSDHFLRSFLANQNYPIIQLFQLFEMTAFVKSSREA